MTNTPILFIVFLLLCGILLGVRNIYFFKLWRLKNNFENYEQYSRIFSSGIQKLILPITVNGKIENMDINKTVKILNFFNYLAILFFIISGIAFFNPII
jgi:hypothetical protein